MHCSLRNLLFSLLLVFLASDSYGTLSFYEDGVVIIDQGQGIGIGPGANPKETCADTILPVYFDADGSCNCADPDLSFKWYFGDGSTAYGSSVSHPYSSGGVYATKVRLECFNPCCDSDRIYSPYLFVYVISGIEVYQIGDPNDPEKRLCFNNKHDCGAYVLPTTLPSSGGSDISALIDWSLQIGYYHINVANQRAPYLYLPPGYWPENNSAWGEQTLYVSIDGSHVPYQQDELITGWASFITQPQTVETFFEKEESQSTRGYEPNWFYYWTQTTANYGNMNYDFTNRGGGAGWCDFIDGTWRTFLGDNCSRGPSPMSHEDEAEGIDFFAWYCRHEERHRLDFVDIIWGPYTNRSSSTDSDHDYLKDSIEDELLPGWEYDNGLRKTFGDQWGYNVTEDLGSPIVDSEHFNFMRKISWTNGNARTEDWAHPGKQWPNPMP